MRPGKKTDVAMPEFDQVRYSRVKAGSVVEQDGAGLGVIQFELRQDHGNVVVGELVEHWLLFAKGEHRNALDLALEHAAHTGGEDGGIAVGGADENFVAMGNCDLLKALDQLREEGIVNVFNDDSKEPTAARHQAARVGVGKVVQLLD